MKVRVNEVSEEEYELDAPDGLSEDELEKWVKTEMEDFPGPATFIGVVSRTWEIAS
ncbi:hypothetical protein HA052_19900 [Chromobacterium haemolyticum]|uniref:Uncharacterized protein n=1 Tax=Chromobacterium fluminis TaxID=3044269 RepID=A0ABX0L753_9NEIS|nr:hypothetical protein [Chromobacterium haemolyticum]NHR07459.1 hypothetical protein [Chromobacterium haemolyticum]